MAYHVKILGHLPDLELQFAYKYRPTLTSLYTAHFSIFSIFSTSITLLVRLELRFKAFREEVS